MADDLYIEIANLRLANEQVAEYGLALLEQKHLLETQYGDLVNQHELLKSEFEQLKIVQLNEREKIVQGEEEEEIFLKEKQRYVDHLNKEIKHYEDELNFLKEDNQRLETDNKKYLSNCQELTERIHDLEQIKIQLKDDLKQSQYEEKKSSDINNDLVKENVFLQQEIERLRKYFIGYDELNFENKKLQENIDDLNRTINEMDSLKTLAESQIIELHENLQEERKQKYFYKQQLDEQMQKESMRNLNSLRRTLNNTHTNSNIDSLASSSGYDGSEDDDVSQITSVMDYSDIFENEQQLTGSLFSEVHVNGIRKLEKECSQLKSSHDNQLMTIHEKATILSSKIEQILDKIFPNKNRLNEFNFDDTTNLLVTSLNSLEQIDNFLDKNLHLFNGEQESTMNKLKQDLNIMMKQYNDTQIIFVKTRDQLLNLSQELEGVHSSISISNDFQMQKTDLRNSNQKIFDPKTNEYIINILHEQVQQIKQSIHNIKKKDELMLNNQSFDTKELQDQIIKQNSTLITKYDQINKLSKLLQENQQTNETALANLKATYENEKRIHMEKISKQRDQLKTLKEDLAKYISAQMTYREGCNEYIIQLDGLKKQLRALEEEKKTLHSLLHTAIEQKLTLTQKLEALEIDHERVKNSRHTPRQTNNLGSTHDLLSIVSNPNNNNSLVAERGRFIPPRIMQAFTTNRNQR